VKILERFPRQRPDLAARTISGETVIVTPADGLVHELDPVASFVWESCDGRHDGRALVSAVVGAFEVGEDRASADLAGLLQEFEHKGLVELLDAAADAA